MREKTTVKELTVEEVKALLKTLDKWELETSIEVTDKVRFCGGCIAYTTSFEGFVLEETKYDYGRISRVLKKGEIELYIGDEYEA